MQSGKETAMRDDIDKDTVLNAAAIFGAWLIIIVACVNPGVVDAPAIVRIAYAA